MIQKGALVRRISDHMLEHISSDVLHKQYPPAGSLCIVISKPREKDLNHQRPHPIPNAVNLKKAIDVMSENKLYKNCELYAFSKV